MVCSRIRSPPGLRLSSAASKRMFVKHSSCVTVTQTPRAHMLLVCTYLNIIHIDMLYLYSKITEIFNYNFLFPNLRFTYYVGNYNITSSS